MICHLSFAVKVVFFTFHWVNIDAIFVLISSIDSGLVPLVTLFNALLSFEVSIPLQVTFQAFSLKSSRSI
jgi:hypothetical protein